MEAKRFVLRKVAGENILVPVGNTALTFNGLCQKALKKNLGRTVSILVGERPVTLSQLLQEFIGICDRMIWLSGEELVQEVLQEYEVSEEQARLDIGQFLTYLAKAGVLE